MERRRESFYDAVRTRIGQIFMPDGSGITREFSAPWREPIWIQPALLTGSAEHRHLANQILQRYWDGAVCPCQEMAERSGRDFGIFQSSILAGTLKRHYTALNEDGRRVAGEHAKMLFRTFNGGAQSDYTFHGSNDNMPMMASMGLILGGEMLGNADAVRHGYWNLKEFRRILARNGWASEFNSSTYSAITLSCAARVASNSDSLEIRNLAREIEERLWTEVILHFHPGTFMQAGPQARCYAVDLAGHTHSLQALFWLLFGPELAGRDPIRSFFSPDGHEVLHFQGRNWSNIAEMCSIFDTEFNLPSRLRALFENRHYPATVRGNAEGMDQYGRRSGQFHTTCHMEREFSLGSVNAPMYGGEQTPGFFLTYRCKAVPADFRDCATVFPVYRLDSSPYGGSDSPYAYSFPNEKFISNRGWFHCLQHRDTVLLLGTPALPEKPINTDSLRLTLLFSAHYHDDFEIYEEGRSTSIAAGEVFIHVQPLIPQAGRIQCRWRKENNYRVLDLVTYEGPERFFSREELAVCFTGLLLTVKAKSGYSSIIDFHREMSALLIG